MTAIVGLFGIGARESATLVRAALTVMGPRGSDRVETWVEDDLALGAVSDHWEVGGATDASARVAYNAAAAVACDASLYYLSDLRSALQATGATPATDSPAGLILAAYSVWGERCVDHIEGDFAFILWDRQARKVVAARDHAGTRPLFYSVFPSGLVVASRLDALTSIPQFNRAFNLMSIADDALFLRVNAPEATAYRDAARLPAAHCLTWTAGTSPRVSRWWDVPIFLRGDGPPFAEALEELRRLLIAAVAERSRHPGGTAIWLSGGYDSSALFAASHLAAERGVPPAQPISISHPPGDPGREDELIESSTRFWRVTPTWLDVDDVPSLVAPVAAARVRDEPFYHIYELSNRALAHTTREAGLRAAIVGNGGDQFFSAGVARLADHFRRGHFNTLVREWREAGGGRDWRLFVRTVVMPNMPTLVLAVASGLRQKRTMQQRLTRRLPAWTNGKFGDLDALQTLNRAGLKRRTGEGHAAVEQSWFLRHVTGERINAAYTATGLLDGIEVKSPFFDSRVLRFAAGRPLDESYARQENKRLLRGAFRGHLPDEVIGPRAARTGLPYRSLRRAASEHAAWVVAEGQGGMILADFGVIDGSNFLSSAGRIAEQGVADVEEAAALVACTQVECWLRARS
ncbi:MAG TPA: asparagine synthase-related protein [Gemmatimonadaceae bacterium]|nr:asparagine synthase-related protein [Gemmatimonadaceae bacterium]